jgi:hypothetical protein
MVPFDFSMNQPDAATEPTAMTAAQTSERTVTNFIFLNEVSMLLK